ncbi:MAG: GGDEF domain-containing protein [Myxococcales bacterium]|nr:MAG: GGDEF domain-containing protein [Myxococcales bacterium]
MSTERTTNPSKTVVTVITSTPKRRGASSQACLVVIYGDDLGRRVPLGAEPIVIGRSSRCDVQVDQDNVSRNHAQVTYNGREYIVSDLGSTNGTFVNHAFVDEKVLLDGDQIKIGRTILKFISGDNVEGQYHEEIYRLMTIDGLTDVYNKRHFHEELEKEISRARRYERTFSLILFDIDHFKQVNDNFGHLAGDAVLRQMAQMVKSRVRRDDIVARLGGEEFGVLLPEVQKRGAFELAEKLRKLVEQKIFAFEGLRLNITISLGIAEWTKDIQDPEQLIKVADEKLYQAKREGRNASRA